MKFQVGKPEVTLGPTGMKPESRPVTSFVVASVRMWQGSANEDCVAVWFFCWNSKTTTSPALAVMLDGVYTRSAPPTMTVWTAPGAEVTSVGAGALGADESTGAGSTEEGAAVVAPPYAAVVAEGSSVPHDAPVAEARAADDDAAALRAAPSARAACWNAANDDGEPF